MRSVRVPLLVAVAEHEGIFAILGPYAVKLRGVLCPCVNALLTSLDEGQRREEGGDWDTYPKRLIRQLRHTNRMTRRARAAGCETCGLRVVHVGLMVWGIEVLAIPASLAHISCRFHTLWKSEKGGGETGLRTKNVRGEMVFRHDTSLARLSWEIVDLGEPRRLVVEASEAQAFMLNETVCALGGATDCHAEALFVSYDQHTTPQCLNKTKGYVPAGRR